MLGFPADCGGPHRRTTRGRSQLKRIFSEFGLKVSKDTVRRFYRARKIAIARINLPAQADHRSREPMCRPLWGSKISGTKFYKLAGPLDLKTVAWNANKKLGRLREQTIGMERLKLCLELGRNH